MPEYLVCETCGALFATTKECPVCFQAMAAHAFQHSIPDVFADEAETQIKIDNLWHAEEKIRKRLRRLEKVGAMMAMNDLQDSPQAAKPLDLKEEKAAAPDCKDCTFDYIPKLKVDNEHLKAALHTAHITIEKIQAQRGQDQKDHEHYHEQLKRENEQLKGELAKAQAEHKRISSDRYDCFEKIDILSEKLLKIQRIILGE